MSSTRTLKELGNPADQLLMGSFVLWVVFSHIHGTDNAIDDIYFAVNIELLRSLGHLSVHLQESKNPLSTTSFIYAIRPVLALLGALFLFLNQENMAQGFEVSLEFLIAAYYFFKAANHFLLRFIPWEEHERKHKDYVDFVRASSALTMGIALLLFEETSYIGALFFLGSLGLDLLYNLFNQQKKGVSLCSTIFATCFLMGFATFILEQETQIPSSEDHLGNISLCLLSTSLLGSVTYATSKIVRTQPRSPEKLESHVATTVHSAESTSALTS